MIKRYSKPGGDISTEFQALVEKEDYLLEGAREIKQEMLHQGIRRLECGICSADLQGLPSFMHQELPFVFCPSCTQMQSVFLMGERAQEMLDKHLSYSKIYPKLNKKEFLKRRRAVYEPKIDFVFEVLMQCGMSLEFLQKQAHWLEIGSGAGYSLSALEEKGCRHILGLERDAELMTANVEMLNSARVECSTKGVDETISVEDFDILIAVFVLEHVQDLVPVQEALKRLRSGTVFFFAVPYMGAATFLESAEDQHAGRNLDGIVHQQVFSDKSVRFFLEGAGYEKVAEWVFGQDAMDFIRFLMTRLAKKYPEEVIESIGRQFNQVMDPLQSVFDQAHLADARHIIAIKR